LFSQKDFSIDCLSNSFKESDFVKKKELLRCGHLYIYGYFEILLAFSISAITYTRFKLFSSNFTKGYLLTDGHNSVVQFYQIISLYGLGKTQTWS